MAFVSHFRAPKDPRWAHGVPRSHHAVMLFSTLLLIPFIVIIIVDYVLLSVWFRDSTVSEEYKPYDFWMRIGIALVPDAVYSLIMFILIFGWTARWTGPGPHPVFALVGSIAMFAFYLCALMFNIFLVGANEIFFVNNDKWYSIGILEQIFQGVLMFMYIWCIVASSVCVHRWRKGAGNVLIVGGEEDVRLAVRGVSGETEGSKKSADERV